MPKYNECGIYELACREGRCSHNKPRKPDVPGGIFKAGDRVYYAENGDWDTGTVKEVRLALSAKSHFEYRVVWDNEDPMDYYTEGQLRTVA